MLKNFDFRSLGITRKDRKAANKKRREREHANNPTTSQHDGSPDNDTTTSRKTKPIVDKWRAQQRLARQRFAHLRKYGHTLTRRT